MPVTPGSRERIDILVCLGGKRYPIEFKHLTQDFDIEHAGERFKQKFGYVHSIDAHACVKDIQRVESWAARHADCGYGFAVWLANDSFWWNSRPHPSAKYIDFSIHDGAVKFGAMEGIVNGEQEKISLRGEYAIQWRFYSDLGASNGLFKYVLLQIHNKQHG